MNLVSSRRDDDLVVRRPTLFEVDVVPRSTFDDRHSRWFETDEPNDKLHIDSRDGVERVTWNPRVSGQEEKFIL